MLKLSIDIMLNLSKTPKEIVIWSSGNTFKEAEKKQPAVIYRTLGAYKIAHALRANNYSTQVIDFIVNFTEDELYEYTVKFIDSNTKCLAVSTTFLLDNITSFNISDTFVNVINKITNEFPNIKLLFGGYGIGVLKWQLPKLNTKHVIYVSQYGEDIVVDVVNYLAGKGQRPTFQIEKIGVENSTTIHIYSSPLTERYNIQTDCFRFSDEDCIQHGETLPIEISRGCIFKCKFCNHLLLGRGKLDYLREMDLIKEELLHNYDKWGTTNYYIACDTFNDTEFKMNAWHQMITSLPFKIKYTAYLRADLLHRFPDVPYQLKETGLFSAFHGIESLGEKASSVIGKGWCGKEARTYIPKLYHDIWNKEVHQTISLITGLPGDTRESLMDTAHWFRDNDLYHVAWYTLGLSTNLTHKNASEFDRNAEAYGYTLNRTQSRITEWKWKTDYWDSKEAGIFMRDKILPYVGTTNSIFGSWSILQLLGYKFDESWFEKSKQWKFLLNLGQLSKSWMSNYKKSLSNL